MNEEIYSYIVSSIDLLNKSIKAQDNKNVHLFSYLYNNYMDINGQLQNFTTNKDVQLLSYCMLNLDQRLQKLEMRIGKIDKKIDRVIDFVNIKVEDKNKIVIESNKPNWFKELYDQFKKWCKRIYDKCYKFIFKKKIQRQIEEEKQRKLEQEKKEIKEKQKIIKNILTKK